MKPSKVVFLNPESTETTNAITRIVDSTEDIDGFISHWFMERGGSLIFRAAKIKTPSKVRCLCVVVTEDSHEVAELYYPLRELASRFPTLKPVDSFIKGFDHMGQCKLDDEALDDYEAKLGYEYNDDLCGMVGPRDSLLPTALSYAIANRGEAQVSVFTPPDCLLPPESVAWNDNESLMSLSLVYQSPHRRKGCIPMFGNFLFVRSERGAVC